MLRWFDVTHEFTIDGVSGRAWYRRVSLPGPGNSSEQDAYLAEALDWLRRVHDDIVRPKPKPKHTDGR